MQIFFLSIIASTLAQVLPIGVVLNVNNPTQIAGIALLNFTVGEMNAQNIFPFPIQLFVRDSQNSIRQAIIQANNLVTQNNIVALIGEFPSGNIMRIKLIVRNYTASSVCNVSV